MKEPARLGILAGTSLWQSNWLNSLDQTSIETSHGTATVYRSDRCTAIQRHDSEDGYRAPHAIKHKRHLKAFQSDGVSCILSIQSTGTLTQGHDLGDFLLPDDFFHPWEVTSFFDDDRGHVITQFSDELRQEIRQVFSSLDETLHTSGTYAQTLGPRFETPAEAQFLKDYADVVGMTAADELQLASELEIPYACLCIVDNTVNGIGDTSIDLEQFQQNVDANLPKVLSTLNSLLNHLID